MKTAQRLEGIGEYYFSQKLREIAALNAEGKNIINLGIGSPDLPPHADVINTLQQEASKPGNHAYQGYKGIPQLRNAFSEWYKKWYNADLDAESEILPLIGSKEGLMHICMTYLNEGDEVLVPNPGYPTYSSAVKLAGGTLINYELNAGAGWQPDLDSLAAAITPNTKMMFVNYPHMPTGQLAGKDLFKKLIAFGKKYGILIVHDNPYSFILNDHPQSILSVEGAKDTAIELNSLSKSHNMAGWRVGVLCGSAKRVEEILRFKSNMDSGMFFPLQMAAAAALKLGKGWHDEVNAIYSKRKLKMIGLLKTIGCHAEDNQAGMFIWASIPGRYKDGYELSDEILYASGVFITPGGIFGSAGEKYVRVSLCSKEEKIIEAISRIEKIRTEKPKQH